MIRPDSPDYISPGEYLRRERLAEFKSEYMDGQVFPRGEPPIPPDNPERHDLIVTNVTREISSRLAGMQFRVFAYATKIWAPAPPGYVHADLSIVTEDPDFEADVLHNPTVMIEVFSPSTEAFERGKKFAGYQKLPSVTDCIMITQNEPLVTQYTRRSDDLWEVHFHGDLQQQLPFNSIGLSLKLGDAYKQVEFDRCQ